MRQLLARVVDVAGQLTVARIMAVGAVVLAASGCSGDERATEQDEPAATLDEYVQALEETVRCLEVEGVTASYLEQPDGSYAIQLGVPERGAGATARIDAAYDDCTERHLSEIQSLYMSTIHPSHDEAIEITRRCLVDAGVLDRDASVEEMDDVTQRLEADPVVRGCWSLPYLRSTSTTRG